VGLLLSSMGVPFEDVVLTLVALPLLLLFVLLAVMQVHENRMQKRFADEAPRRSRRARWYHQRPYRWALGLLALGAVPALVMHLTGDTTAPAAVTLAAVANTATATPAAPPPPPVARATADPMRTPETPATTTTTTTTTQPAQVRAAVQAAVQAWAKAWSAGQADLYLSMYSTVFKPAGKQTRPQWERTRRERVTPAQQIRIDLDDLAMDLAGDTQADVRFVQRYAAKHFQDRSYKQLHLVLENGQWKIASETVLATLAPEASAP
jgi:ketosteroid isomerase-like protein